MDPSQLPDLLNGIADRAENAATPAVTAMARSFQAGVKRTLSMSGSHPPGTFPTPSAAFIAPPSMTTGALRASVTAEVFPGSGSAQALVGPHTIYASVQEYGRDIWRRNRRFMHWVANGTDWYRVHVYIPDRPYMRPTRARMIGNGSLSRAGMNAFEIAVWGR